MTVEHSLTEHMSNIDREETIQRERERWEDKAFLNVLRDRSAVGDWMDCCAFWPDLVADCIESGLNFDGTDACVTIYESFKRHMHPRIEKEIDSLIEADRLANTGDYE